MRKILAFDAVILAWVAALTLLVLVARPEGTAVYLAYHGAALALMALILYAHGRHGGRFWRFARYWYVVLVILASFRELHYLVPQIHPFDDYRYDRILAEFDRRWLGDVDRFFFSMTHPLIVDFLHLCYWFYFPLVIIPGAALYRRGEFGRLREYTAVVVAAYYLSYAGYIAVPAVGPHHFFDPRPPVLDGWIAGGPLHRALMAAEWNMPDAFPSGHALLAMTVLVLAWRHHRRTFWVVLVPAVGCIAATMALRYHYVVDVLASVALLPVGIVLGRILHRTLDRSLPPEAP